MTLRVQAEAAERTERPDAPPPVAPPAPAWAPAVPRPSRRSPPTLRQMLLNTPSRFTFDAAVAAMMRASRRGEPGNAVRFQATPGLPFVPSDVLAIRSTPEGGFQARTGLLGLTGPGGILPRPYTDIGNTEARQRSSALADFLDMLAQRPLAQLAQAGIKYRPHRTADAAAVADRDASHPPRDSVREGLLALLGYAEPSLLRRLRPGPDPLLFYAGLFAARPRSAGRLAGLLTEWLGRPVEVEQFVGTWLELGRDQMSSMPRNGAGQFNRLGVDAAAGTRAWDIQSNIVLRVGPLTLPQFEALLPGTPLLDALMALVRAYLGAEIGFAVNPVLAADAVPLPALDAAAGCRLGWTGWLPVSAGRTEDAADARFKPGMAGHQGQV